MSDTPLAPVLARLRERFAKAGAFEGMMLALGALTGLFTGLLAAGLIYSIREVQAFAWGSSVAWWEVLLVPTVGALLAGIWITYVAPESSGSGVTRVMESLALRGGRFRKRVPFTGMIATGLALGTGASGGRETPIALLGGSAGSMLGRAFALDEDRTRSLVGAGVAAGIGASFNAPIGGMMFAIEIILGDLKARSLQVVVVASVVSAVVARQLVGSGITYELPGTGYELSDPFDLFVFIALGIVAAGFGILLLRAEDRALSLFAWVRTKTHWRPIALMAGGLVVGLTALAVPEVLGTGDHLPPIAGIREPIQHMIDGSYGVGWKPALVLLALFGAKLIATLGSVGSQTAVGTFSPTLFMGAALGGALGALTANLPGLNVEPGAVALVGMAAAFAAADKAPLTAILIAFELTSDYALILPLMLACGLATYLSSLVEPDSIYVHPLRKRGITVHQPQDIDVMQAVSVGEVMTRTHPTIRQEERYPEVKAIFDRTGSHGFAVVDGGHRLVGVLTHTDMEKTQSRDDVLVERRDVDSLTAADLCTEGPVVVHPDEPVYTAVHRMAALDIGRVPVVERGTNRLLGLVRRADVLRAYQRGLNRHLGDQQRKASRRLRDLAGVTFLELTVHENSSVAHQPVRDIAWPARTVLTTIRRMGRVVMPTGDTVLEPGDDVVVLTDEDAVGQVRTLMTEEIGDALDPTDPAQRSSSQT